MTVPVPPHRPGVPWPSPLPPPNVCCELAAGGDFCDCIADAAELFDAFRSPLVLSHDNGAWEWTRPTTDRTERTTR